MLIFLEIFTSENRIICCDRWDIVILGATGYWNLQILNIRRLIQLMDNLDWLMKFRISNIGLNNGKWMICLKYLYEEKKN